MLIRLNSLASGFSGIKETTIRTLHQILEAGITPQVPIKGSISASGDLSPLSYIGGVVQGKPGLSKQTFPCLYRFQSPKTRCKSNLLPRRVSRLKFVPELSNADSEIIKLYGPAMPTASAA